MQYCKQIFNDDCGFACLKMLLAHFSKNRRYLYLPNSKLEGKYSFLDLVNLGRKYGLFLKGFYVEDLSVLQNFLPCIITIRKNEITHFCILYKIVKNKYYIIDPSEGKKTVSKEEFNCLFTKEILIKDNDDIKIYKPKNTIISIVKYYCIFSFIINILSFGFFYFLDYIDNSAFIGLLMYVCLFFFVNKINLLIVDNIYENKISKNIIINNNVHMTKFFDEIYISKKNIFGYISSFSNNFSLLLLLSFLIVINSRFLSLILVLILVINFLRNLRRINKLSDDIFDCENRIKNSKNTELKIKYFERMKNLIFKIKSKSLLDEIVNQLIYLIATILVCFIENKFSLNFIIFNYFSLYIFNDKLVHATLLFKEKNNFISEINKLNTLIEYNK